MKKGKRKIATLFFEEINTFFVFVNDNYYFKENYKNKTTKKNQLKFSFITQIQPNDKYEIEKQNVNQKRKHANDD